jgi:hypothetical protein
MVQLLLNTLYNQYRPLLPSQNTQEGGRML